MWNRIVQSVAHCIGFRQGFFADFLLPKQEKHDRLFSKYQFNMDLSLGRLQKIFFVKRDSYEIETQVALRRLVKPGMVVCDIGANSGFFTILMADLVGPSGRVCSFEPFSANFNLLKSNVISNGLSQVRTFQLALSNKAGTAILSLNPKNDGGHSLGDLSHNPDLAGRDLNELQEKVQTDTLDEFLKREGIERVDVIKIDVEGAEILVFEGSKHLLCQPHAPALICEVGEDAQKQIGKTERDLRELLYAYGYRSYWLNHGGHQFGIETPVRCLTNVLFKK